MANNKGKQLLDDKIVDYFKTLENLFNCQQELQDHLSSGFLNLSKARYTMGVKAVSSLQFDGRTMKAASKVIVNEETDDKSSYDDTFIFVRNGTEVENENESNLRQRKKGGDQEEDFDDMDWINDQIKKMGLGSLDGLPSEPKANPSPTNHDPLKWFGVLVPQTLRSSQQNFQNATQLVVEMANLRLKLLAIKESYAALKAECDTVSS